MEISPDQYVYIGNAIMRIAEIIADIFMIGWGA